MPKFKKLIIFSALFVFLIFLAFVAQWYFNKYDTRDYVHKGFFPLTTLKPIWERKMETSQVLKLGIITDTHVRSSRAIRKSKEKNAARVLKESDEKILKKFNSQMKDFQPDGIIHLGDIIEGTNEGTHVGMYGLKLVAEQLGQNNIPIYWAIGNHDLRSVTKDEFKQTLQLERLDQIVDKDDYRLIFLDANYRENEEDVIPGKGHTFGYLHPKTLVWLEENLKTDKRVFVFMHQAAFDRILLGDNGSPKQSIDNALVLRNILENYNVEAIFNGHIEVKLYEEEKGVKYYSLTGTEKSDLYPNSYYELTIDGANPKIRMFYTEKESGEDRVIDFKDDQK